MKPKGCTCIEVPLPAGVDLGDDAYAIDMDPHCPVHNIEDALRLLQCDSRGESADNE